MLGRLSSQVHAVTIDRETVFLDLRADEYLVLSDPEAGISLLSDRRVRVEGELAAELTAAGLIEKLADPQRQSAPLARAPAAVPAARSVPGGTARPRLRDAIDFAAALTSAPVRFGRRSLAPLIDYARRRPDGVDGQASAETLRRAAVFPHLLAWSPWQGECLFRSFLLLRFLRAAGCDARWVFGVRTWPFGAHCWLQSGDVVLNDAVERVAGFKPILIV